MLALALLFALPAAFDGSTWQDAAPCDDLADLTFSVCAVVQVPAGTSTSGRAAYAAASGSSSTQYVTLGLPDNLLVPEFTVRNGSTFYRARGTASLADGQPHTLLGVANGTTLQLFVDGVLAGSGSLSGATASARGLCTYGALRRANNAPPPAYTVASYWIGDVTTARTWDRAIFLSEADGSCGLAPPMAENCHGHTALVWDPYVDPTVSHFEVERTVEGIGAWSLAGSTLEKNRPSYIEDGTIHPAFRSESWDLLRAWSLPAEGVTYAYRARAVRGAEKSLPSNVVVCGPQDPTRCYPEACP
jgi:hypothetical protein